MIQAEQVYFDNEKNFPTVRHLKLQGTNFEIGKQIGIIAVERYGESIEQHETNPDFANARRKYFQRNCPHLWERMLGVASVLGVDPEDNRYDISTIALHLDVDIPTPGCSSVYYPPSTTINKNG